MIAYKVTRLGGDSGKKLFFYLLLLSTIMTVFTSNDVVVLTVTPIICYMMQGNDLNPDAYLLSNFIIINIASMTLYIGNPTNVIVAQAFGINFIQYSAWMTLPTLFSTLVAFASTYILLRKKIPTHIPTSSSDSGDAERFGLKDRNGAIFGVALLLGCLVCLMVVPLVVGHGVEVWVLTVPFAGLLMGKDLVWDLVGWSWLRREGGKARERRGLVDEIPVDTFSMGSIAPRGSVDGRDGDDEGEDGDDGERKDTSQQSLTHFHNGSVSPLPTSSTSLTPPSNPPLKPPSSHKSHKPTTHLNRFTRTLKHHIPTLATILTRLPWTLIPFSLSMFILVESLHQNGWTARLATALAFLSPNLLTTVFVTGIISTLASNLLNNLPMTILFARIFQHQNFSTKAGNFGQRDMESIRRGGLFALVVGSNVGANVLFVGSLAGLMWSDLLRKRGVRFSQGKFLRWCSGVTPWVVVAGCGCLAVELVVMGFDR
ncbi:hypothetical protein HK097_002969 [Rhizophlyctis rosea]|uniref:Citrate transporter-like domain-containing protein n=1 Tax=Rhizophlyctis rosea TaxID=64517 RepID=A0AAD5S2T8_9FUNG|nr:hypothetical protein HK097_002969 [Rhizophlyctis rosea]